MLLETESTFPKLSADDMALLFPLASREEYSSGTTIFQAGDQQEDLVVVESGSINVINPNDNNKVIVTLEPGQFSGDIDLLSQRPLLVSGVASGQTRVLRVPARKLSEVLIKIPRLSDKLIRAFETRSELYGQTGQLGLKVVGPRKCKETNLIREFLHRNFVGFAWYEPESPEGKKILASIGADVLLPIVQIPGKVLVRPTLQELANTAGVWRHFENKTVDFLIIGAGPAGITAAVYGASEGLSTLVLDWMGPGGQAGGSSKIENLMGFPTGISGNDLALKGVMQMLKFGAHLYAPVRISDFQPASSASELHTLKLDCGAIIQAKVVLVATGMRWRKLDISNAERFERNGMYHVCTSVEAVLHDGTDVGVIGGGNSAGQAATFLAECCPERIVNLFVRGKLEAKMSAYLHERVRCISNIHIYEDTVVTAVSGETVIDGVEINRAGEISHLPLSAIFVFIGAEPCTEDLPVSIGRDRNGFILTGLESFTSGQWPLQDREPCPLETTVPRVLAAGDVRSGSTKRVGFAVGDGAQSVSCAHDLV